MMKILVFLCLITQFSFACNSLYLRTKFYQLNHWGELEKSIEDVLNFKKIKTRELVFERSHKNELVDIYQSNKPLIESRVLKSQVNSKEFRYWKSLIKNDDEMAVVSVYNDNKKLASFFIKTLETDLYSNYYFNFRSLEAYESKIIELQESYSLSNPFRGFRDLYKPPARLFEAQLFHEANPSFAKSILELSKGERVLGLARDNLKESFVIFEGYSHGVVNISGIDYLEVRIDREDMRFSLINVLSLQTAVY